MKRIGIPQGMAQADSEIHGRLLARAGADGVVYPSRERATGPDAKPEALPRVIPRPAAERGGHPPPGSVIFPIPSL